MHKRGLLIIDMQNDFLGRWSAERVEGLFSSVNGLVAAFRAAGLPVIWARQEFRADLADAAPGMRDKTVPAPIAGTMGADIAEGFDVRPNDPVIVNKRLSGFFRTNLESLLAGLGVEELVVCGVDSYGGVQMTAIDGYQRDMRVAVASDGVDADDREHLADTLARLNGRIAKVATCAEIAAEIKTPAAA